MNKTNTNKQTSGQPVEANMSTNDGVRINGTHFTKDINGKVVFQDPVMCSQFLKDYSGMDIFKNIKPEDIIDETKKYQAYLGITFESDTVNRIKLDGITDVPIFVVSLIEHKSDVDYNVAMQLLRYMVCIWTEYGKEMLARGEGNPSNKGFRYPPIIPIVYYEGKARWTASLSLKDRISMSEAFAEYIPDFSYKIICNYNYTNDELLAKEDEISLFMILNKVQTAEDMSEFLRLDDSKLNEILKKSPEQTLRIIVDAMWSLCMKLNVPQDEAVDYVGRVWNRDMGYLFENIEKMDIQEERRKTKEAREELARAKHRLNDAENRADEAETALAEAKKEIQALKKQLNKKG